MSKDKILSSVEQMTQLLFDRIASHDELNFVDQRDLVDILDVLKKNQFADDRRPSRTKLSQLLDQMVDEAMQKERSGDH